MHGPAAVCHRRFDRLWALAALALALLSSTAALGQGPARASVELPDQRTDGGALLVDHVQTSHGGFVVVYDRRPGTQAAEATVLGVSPSFGPGYQPDLVVTLDPRLSEDRSVVAVVHRDSNGNQVFENHRDESKDPPYEVDGRLVLDDADVRLLGQEEPAVPGWTAPLVGGTAGILVGVGLAWWHATRREEEG